MRPEENKPLFSYTTFGIGGPARWFVEATSEEDVAEAAAWAGEKGVALFVLGGGSNLLVSDAGFDGLVLRVGLRGVAVRFASAELDSEGGGGFNPRTRPDESTGALAPEESSAANSAAQSIQTTYQAA